MNNSTIKARKLPEGIRRRYLDPEVLSHISPLSLRAKEVVEGILTGLHRSLHKGQSIEFAEHKEYSPGDESRHIDWKAFGKQDKYYVKQFEQETNLRAWIVLDSSGSMGYPTVKRGMNKFEYGATVAASLSYLMLQQADSVGLVTFQGDAHRFIPTRSQSSHFQAILGVLESCSPMGRSDLPSCLDGLEERVRKRGMVIVISDLLGPVEMILRSFGHLRSRSTEIVVFHVLSREEIQFPFSSPVTFVGMEGEGRILADPEGIRQAYLKEFQAFLDSCRRGCLEQGIDYCLCDISEPLDRALLRFLARREARR